MIGLASYTIGPKIGLDGEADFRKSLNNINNTLRTHDSELKKVSSSYAENGKSEEALKAKNEVLNKSITAQEKKITEVKKALEYSKSEYGENADQTLKWQRVLNNAETDLNNLKTEVKKNEKALNDMQNEVKESDKAIDNLGDSADKSGNKFEKLSKAANGIGSAFKVVGGAVAGAGAMVAGGVSAINEITESTREYREDIGKLETAFKTAGISQGVATETYKSFFSVLGEEDRSVEAVNHLAKLTKSQSDLKKWTDICAGVWGTFGDSLPIEGLTEAANETAKVGQVTGPLADALNWAGVSEDAFNEKLEKCNTEQERASLITNTLNGLYKEAAKNYKAANGEIMNAQRAQSELTDATAKMGDALEPVSTGFKLLGTDIINSLAPAVEVIGDGLTEVLNGNEDAAETIGKGLSGIIDSVEDISEKIMPIITSILTTLIPSLITILVDALPEVAKFGMDILINGLLSSLPALLSATLNMATTLIDTLSENAPILINTIVDIFYQLIEILTDPDMLVSLIMVAIELVIALANGIVDNIDKLTSVIPLVFENLLTAILMLLPKLGPVAIDILSTLASALGKYVKYLVTIVPNIINALFDALSNVFGDAREWGQDFIQNIIYGIKNMISNLRDSILDVADTISSYLHFSIPEKGPLRDVPNWMPDMIDLLVDGIEDNEYRVSQAAKSLADIVNDEMSINADVKNVGYGDNIIILNSTTNLDGVSVANSTQRIVTNQQTASNKARGVA